MKAYNEYMNNISVSDILHHRFVSHAINVRPAPRSINTRPIPCPIRVRRHAAAFVCLAVILLGAVTVPRLLQSSTTPTEENIPPVSQPGASVPTSGAADRYALTLNKANSQLSTDKAYIPGHFWQELTPDELHAVFPNLAEAYTIAATANFRGDGTLVNIVAHAASENSNTAYIQVVPGEIILDYALDGEVKTSNILGVEVTAGYYEGRQDTTYFASFKLSGIGYYVELTGGDAEKAELHALLDKMIGGGAADLSVFNNPVIPELRKDALDLNGARADADFGAYLPQKVPSGFTFESAMRFINQERNSLSALWVKGMGDIHWRISVIGEDDKARITSVADTRNYDLSLYPVPHADSVPDELRQIVNDPVFRSGELTLEAVRTRAYEIEDAGDISGPRMRFGVLYGNTLVEINVKGVTPEEIFRMLQQIKGNGKLF